MAAATPLAIVVAGIVWCAGFPAYSVEIRRKPSSEGVNAVALLAGIHGAPISRNSFVADDNPTSAREIQRLLARHLCRSRTRRVTYDVLTEDCIPSVVLLRHESGDAGNFYIVVSAGPEEITAVQCATLTVHVFSTDEFRRRWTGHVIVPETRTSRGVHAIIAVVTALSVALLWRVFRLPAAAAARTRAL